MDLISPRPDIVFLRRRLRTGEKALVTAVAQNFLRISGPDDIMPVGVAIPDKPCAAGTTVLVAGAPVVRLNARQSAIGSLSVSGATAFAWETASRATGTESGAGAARMPVHANRPLVERVGADVIVGLRHVHKLRRLILSADTGRITATLPSGAQIIVDSRDGQDVLHLSVIGSVIEARVEAVDAGSDVRATFTIG